MAKKYNIKTATWFRTNGTTMAIQVCNTNMPHDLYCTLDDEVRKTLPAVACDEAVSDGLVAKVNDDPISGPVTIKDIVPGTWFMLVNRNSPSQAADAITIN